MGRIVVNFEPGKAPAAHAKRRRWPRILALLALVVLAFIVVIAVIGFFSWRHFQSTPEYSLALLVDATQRNDAAELANRIDDEEVAKNMVATVRQKAIDRYGGSINATTQQQIDKAMPSLLPGLKQTIHNEVVNEVKNFATVSPPNPKPFIILLTSVPALLNVTTEGDVAKAVSKASDRSFELTMRRDSDRWKVVSFSSEAVVQRVVDTVMKELPPIGAFDSNNPLLKIPGRPRKRRR